MNNLIQELPEQTATSQTGIMHLKRYWQKSMLKKSGQLPGDALMNEWNLDNALLNSLGLGLEQTIVHLYNSDETFEEFEHWIRSVVDISAVQERIQAFNAFLITQQLPVDEQPIEKILDEEDLAFWEENGYVIIKQAISADDCSETVRLICEHLQLDPNDPSTWYSAHPDRQGIMLQLFQHPQLEKNRKAARIRKAFEQLWGRTDLMAITDRVGFNPPETANWKFPGPRMHWDVSLALPIPFGLQGILYLTDTAANQGAFSLVPGFHHKVEPWLNSLAPGTDPRKEDIEALGVIPIAAGEGDLIIWHHALPHGSSPNNAEVPRYVQYINFVPLDMEHRDKWI